jgi:hypothetical protein
VDEILLLAVAVATLWELEIEPAELEILDIWLEDSLFKLATTGFGISWLKRFTKIRNKLTPKMVIKVMIVIFLVGIFKN